MLRVTRLMTYVEVDDPVVCTTQFSVSVRHDAILDGGTRVLLLDDRGWAQSGPPDVWERTSVEEIEDTARVVVGPDAPFAGRSQDDMETDHWNALAAVLRSHGVEETAWALQRLPHDVVLGEQLLARVGRRPDPGTST